MQVNKNHWERQLKFVRAGILFCLMSPASVKAQIIPDETLPNNSSVNLEGEVQQITGGSQLGRNLFHSFKNFSVPTASTAYFNNALDIQNIISRVTGGSVSNIDGLIKANGTANVFLLNPNGIIFGPNASLNIGGSFLASTASSLNFADGNQFNATAPQTAPLLKVSVPIGLQFNTNPGLIRLQGNGYNSIASSRGYPRIIRASSSPGLQVNPGKTLALIGGDVALEGGVLTAEGGRIELGSAARGQVSLISTNSGWSLGYDNVLAFKGIALSQQALVNVSGSSSGSVHLQGSRVRITDGSLVWSQNRGSQPGGNLSVNAVESLELNGTSSSGDISSGLATEAVGDGNGGDIEIFTNELSIKNGAAVATVTYGSGKGGNLKVNASKFIGISGFSQFNSFFIASGIGTLTYGPGSGGDFTISTGSLTITDGGLFNTNTFGPGSGGDFTISTGSLAITNGGTVGTLTFGSGKGGDVIVNANSSVELIGATPILFAPSVLSSGAFNIGNAGNLKINTPKLVVRDGGAISASTVANGNAGSITINASESVEVSGREPVSLNRSTVGSTAGRWDNETFRQQFRTPLIPKGAAGELTINTGQLTVTNGGLVSVTNDGSGSAGKVQINANSVRLDNQAGITASTQSGEGGDISINSRDLLLLRNNSQISAEARGTGDGGNITLNTDILAALEDSDITANAQGGTGGRVTITTQGIFRSPDSDITATGGSPELNGTVEINTLDVDPSRGLVTLPTEPVDVTGLIAQGCPGGAGSTASKFVITGTGGIPRSPNDPLKSYAVWHDLPPSQVADNSMSPATEQANGEPAQIVEAQGWRQNPDGTITLTAEPSGVVADSTLNATPSSCHPQPSLSRVPPSTNAAKRND